MKTKHLSALMLLSAMAFTACKKSTEMQGAAADTNKLQTLTLGQQTIADFETTGVAPAMYVSTSPMAYSLVNKGGTRCGNITTTTGLHENIYTEPLDGTFKFTTANPNITVKVYTAAAVTVNFIVKVENTVLTGQAAITSTLTSQAIPANTWTNLTFPFTTGANSYNKITITFEDGSATAGRIWYFDDITAPQLTYPVTLFNRVSPGATGQLGLFIPINTGGSWFADHIAAASILKPTETKDGKWRMYVRGSSIDGHATIGMFDQGTTGFDPTQVVSSGTGGWIQYTANPVISYDASHKYEDFRVLSPVPVEGPNGNALVYYTSKDTAGEKSVCLASANNTNGTNFVKDSGNPFLSDVPPSSFGTGYGALTYTIYESSNYYHFNHGGGVGGSQMWISKAASSSVMNQPINILARGAAGDPDSQSIEGGRLFKVTGSSLWFMVYSESASHSDYPERLHCAYATDAELQAMTPWHKIVNAKPFFLRGNAGQWDQGAMWTGDVIEVNQSGTNYLYMYYEAWGKQGAVVDRNNDYFSGGHSQLGIAKVTTADFLNWVAGN